VKSIQNIFYHFVRYGELKNTESLGNNQALLIDQDIIPFNNFSNCDLWFANDIAPRHGRIDWSVWMMKWRELLQVMEDTDKRCLLEKDFSSRVQCLIARLYRMTQQVQAVREIGIISIFLIMKFVFDGTNYCHRIPLFCVWNWWAKLRHVVNGRGFCNISSCTTFKLVLMSWITEILMAVQEV